MEPDGFYRMTPLEVATGWVAGMDPPDANREAPNRHHLDAPESTHLLCPLLTSIFNLRVGGLPGGTLGISNRLLRAYLGSPTIWSAHPGEDGVDSQVITFSSQDDSVVSRTVIDKDITGGGDDLANAVITDNSYSKSYSPQGAGPAGGGASVLIASSVLSGGDGTFSFTVIPGTYNQLEMTGMLRSDRVNTEDVASMQFNTDIGGNYGFKFARFYDVTSSAGRADNSNGEMELGFIDAANSDADCFSAVRFTIPMYANTNVFKVVLSESMNVENQDSANDMTRSIGMGNWRNKAAITSIQIFPSIGTNFKQYSALYLYGVR